MVYAARVGGRAGGRFAAVDASVCFGGAIGLVAPSSLPDGTDAPYLHPHARARACTHTHTHAHTHTHTHAHTHTRTLCPRTHFCRILPLSSVGQFRRCDVPITGSHAAIYFARWAAAHPIAPATESCLHLSHCCGTRWHYCDSSDTRTLPGHHFQPPVPERLL